MFVEVIEDGQGRRHCEAASASPAGFQKLAVVSVIYGPTKIYSTLRVKLVRPPWSGVDILIG